MVANVYLRVFIVNLKHPSSGLGMVPVCETGGAVQPVLSLFLRFACVCECIRKFSGRDKV
jgi:hypothetical protein